MAFTGPIDAGAMDIWRKPSPIKAIASKGRPAISPHRAKSVPCALALPAIIRSTLSAEGLREFEPSRDAVVFPVRRKKKLKEVVASNGNEVDKRENVIELVDDRRHLDHNPDAGFGRQLMTVVRRVLDLLVDVSLRCQKL